MMAIINYINPPDINCPVCRTKLTEFQTYHGTEEDSIANKIFEFWECHIFTGFCNNEKCLTMTEFVRKMTHGTIEDYDMTYEKYFPYGLQIPKITMGPSKNGSKNCANAEVGRNGSVASGGTVKYCTCDVCF